MSARPRVLLVAEQCNPEMVSVPLVGWSLVDALRRRDDLDTHLVTQVRNRDAFQRAGLTEGEDFTALDTEAIAAPIEKLANKIRGGTGVGWTTLMAMRSTTSYVYFDRLLWKRFGGALRDGAYDLVHRVTPVSPSVPVRYARRLHRAGVPLVWGPINGGVPWPKQFDAVRKAEKEWLSKLRGTFKLLPSYGSSRRHATAILVGSRTTLNQMPAEHRDRCIYLPENAIDPSRFTAQRHGPAHRPVRVVFVGRLVPLKGVDMLLEAAAPLIQRGELTVTILGDGPEMGNIRAQVEREQLGAGVDLPGWVEHTRLQHVLAEHDVLGFPSIREFGGGVVLEAMAVGLVPVVIDYGGPGELVTPQTGYTVPMASRAEIVARLRATFEKITADSGQLITRSEAARRYVADWFTWSRKAEQVAEVYRWVLQQGEKPDFGMPLGERASAGPG